MTHKELQKFLKKNGCQFHHHGKSHNIWYNPKSNVQFPVPRHGSKEIKTGTVQAIIKEAGLKKCPSSLTSLYS